MSPYSKQEEDIEVLVVAVPGGTSCTRAPYRTVYCRESSVSKKMEEQELDIEE